MNGFILRKNEAKEEADDIKEIRHTFVTCLG